MLRGLEGIHSRCEHMRNLLFSAMWAERDLMLIKQAFVYRSMVFIYGSGGKIRAAWLPLSALGIKN